MLATKQSTSLWPSFTKSSWGIRGVVFDLDGTLVDSRHAMNRAISLALDRYGVGMTLREFDTSRTASLAKFFSQFLEKRDVPKAIGHFQRVSMELVSQVPLFPGVYALLQDLQRAGVPVGLWTGRDSDSTTEILKHNEITSFFQHRITSCNVRNNKPHPEGLLKLAGEHFRLPAKNLLMIGNDTQDWVGAHRAGALFAAARWDWRESALAVLQAPDFVFHSVDAMRAWVFDDNRKPEAA